MFHKNIKLVIAIAIIGWGGYEFSQGHIGNGISHISYQREHHL